MKELIHKTLSRNGPMTRTQLCEKIIGHPTKKRTTIYDLLVKLIREKRVIKYPRMDGNRGRPNVYFKAL